MKSMRMSLYTLGVATVLSLGLMGCPPDVGVGLLVSPESLDYGADQDELLLRVSKTYTGGAMDPMVIEADEEWVLPQNCLSISDDCVSRGPNNAIRIPVRIDRNKLTLGLNVGTLRLHTNSASVQTVSVAAYETAQADFTAKQRQVSFGRPVEFQDLSQVAEEAGAISRWVWHFGDGSVSTLPNPFHLYQHPGLFDVSLTITTTEGISRTVTKAKFVRVQELAATVDFVASKTNVDVNEEIVFTDLSHVENTPILSRKWSFGDGETSSALTPRYRYAAPGMYTVSLTITTDAGDLDQVKENYMVVRTSEGPHAKFVFDAGGQANPFAGEIVQFYDLSTAGSAPITDWAWDFGDDGVSTEQNPAHRFTQKGEYNVSLTVTSQYGTDTKRETVSVAYRPPKADFDAMPRRQFVGQPVSFIDKSDPGFAEIASWLWSFGDNTASTARNPVRSYANPGVYTVTLQVTGSDPDQRQDEIEKKDFITIIEGPQPAFKWTPHLAVVNDRVTFDASDTEETTEPILRYQWDFGDGSVGQGITRNHRFRQPGRYPVTLTVSTATGTASLTKEIVIDQPPIANFRATPRQGVAHVDTIGFTVNEQPSDARPITRYFWEFGDGESSSEAAPGHIYQRAGVFTVRLTVRYRHSQAAPGDAELVAVRERERYITITGMSSPYAEIAADKTWAYVNEPVTYSITTATSPNEPITHYSWDMGDGTIIPKTTPTPVTHSYNAPGHYAVRLTVEAAALPPEFQRYTAYLEPPISIVEDAEIDQYVSFEDGCFQYTNPVQQPITMAGQTVARAYLIYSLTSQCWNPDDAVHDDYVEWVHSMVIYDPIHKSNESAMLFIDGGSRNSTPVVEDALSQLAVLVGSPVVHIKNIPSQPIIFKDEVIVPGEEDNYSGEAFVLRRRSEDAAIAYSYDRYLKSWLDTDGAPTPEWPLLFPMTKAAVKAMDVAEEVLADVGVSVDGFVVTGASKRGWTTWLTGAVDQRVKAIAPIVINVLNMSDHLQHHRNAYGYWSPAIYDYAQKGIFDQLLPGDEGTDVSPEALALLEQVDPYEYALKGRYPMPKFMINATGDEFFVPDTAEFYFHDLQGDKHMSYVPNVGHGMGGIESTSLTDPSNPLGMLLAWYMTVTQEMSLPQFDYVFEPDGAIRVIVDPANPPTRVRKWRATSIDARDFRNPVLGAAWTSENLSAAPDGSYLATVPTPPPGSYTAFFVQLEFSNSAQFPATLQPLLQMAGYSVPSMIYTTGVRVTPEAYPEFTGYVANSERPDAVAFDEDKLPVIVVYGTPYEMGHYYGQLMADDINAFIPAFINAYLLDSGNSETFLMNAWAHDSVTLDPRLIEEMLGIADAPGVAVTLEQLQMAHAAAMRERIRNWTATSTAAYRELIQGTDAAHSVTINGPLARQLHQYQCAVMYIPDAGLPHTVFTYAGLTFGRTGVNLGGISAVEVPDPDGGDVFDPQRRSGAALIRSILYDALSLRDAVGMLKANAPRRRTTLIFGDGRNELRGAMLRLNSNGDIETERYDLATHPDWALQRRGLVADSEPLLRSELHNLLYQYILAELPSGLLTLDNLYMITATPPFARPNRNLLNVVYNSAGYWLQIDVAVAKDNDEARLDAFETIDMQRLLP